jgi:hypothetical protein
MRELILLHFMLVFNCVVSLNLKLENRFETEI